MKITFTILVILLVAGPVVAQRPSDPAMLIPQAAPKLDYAPVESPLYIPAETDFGKSSDLKFDSKGHLWILNRGPKPVAEFDENGRFLRSFGEGVFGDGPHGLFLDEDGNIWATDFRAHIVVKLSPQGDLLLTLGTLGEAGKWDEAIGSRLLNQPNSVVVNKKGDVFVAQGHSPTGGDPRILKFDSKGNFIQTWGGKGSGPGQFALPHGIVIDAGGRLWVMDRTNQRIQVFEDDGRFVREMKYAGLPCGAHIGEQYVYMVNGFAGQLLKLDLDGSVLEVLGRPGEGLGEFGEAHNVAVSPSGEIFVADVIREVHKFVQR